MRELNPQQREAVRYLDSPLLVLAGAGSGKTRVITQKIVYLLRECGMEARRIAAITFTNKAAREMRERVGKLVSVEAVEALQISTFHSLGARILREEASLLGYKPRFSIFDATDCLGVISDLAGSVDKQKLRQVQSIISRWKNALILPSDIIPEDEAEALAARVYPSYDATLRTYQAMDFDDLIMLPVVLFRQEAEIALKWQTRIHYLLIDEYQDTNACQYRLLKDLTGPRQQFTAVGDDDQSIYGWRGADIANLRRLPEDYPNLKIIKLEQNYRSTISILRAANHVIAHNEKLFEKKLWSDLGVGDPVCVSAMPDNEKEAESVVTRLLAHRLARRGKWSDYAILYRSNHLARLFEQQLRDRKAPYVLSGGQSFFDKAEIKDLLAYLRLFHNPDDDPAFIRAISTPRRGVGATTLQVLGAYAGERHLSLFAAASETGMAARVPARQYESLVAFCAFIARFSARARMEAVEPLLDDLLVGIGYEEFLRAGEARHIASTKWANVRDFCGWLGRKGEEEGKSLVDLIQNIALINLLEQQENSERQDAVQLSTLHAAKGLEYPHVFLVGVEEGILPHWDSVENGKIEEERRLMYVGITRARQSLSISYCERRRREREIVFAQPSRFIAELGEDARFSGKDAPLPDRERRAAWLKNLREILEK
ncbi:MAG: UvrD-helicase domain-containing protein [Betaproteobacteria bacterium]|nr:UvrD-helicase domain-containing protein [Betaproteobacteria bacterium]